MLKEGKETGWSRAVLFIDRMQCSHQEEKERRRAKRRHQWFDKSAQDEL